MSRYFFPESKIMAVHVDAINHCSLTKNELRRFLEKEGLENNIIAPGEGDTFLYDKLMGK